MLTYAAAFVEAPGLSARGGAADAPGRRRSRCAAHAEGSANAGRLLNRVADTLSEAGSGSAGVSLAAALINPETGEGSYALAGAAMRSHPGEPANGPGDRGPAGRLGRRAVAPVRGVRTRDPRAAGAGGRQPPPARRAGRRGGSPRASRWSRPTSTAE